VATNASETMTLQGSAAIVAPTLAMGISRRPRTAVTPVMMRAAASCVNTDNANGTKREYPCDEKRRRDWLV
jgi:hypothetical protein